VSWCFMWRFHWSMHPPIEITIRNAPRDGFERWKQKFIQLHIVIFLFDICTGNSSSSSSSSVWLDKWSPFSWYSVTFYRYLSVLLSRSKTFSSKGSASVGVVSLSVSNLVANSMPFIRELISNLVVFIFVFFPFNPIWNLQFVVVFLENIPKQIQHVSSTFAVFLELRPEPCNLVFPVKMKCNLFL